MSPDSARPATALAGPRPADPLRRATDAFLRVPLHIKIVVAAATCSGLAFVFGLTGIGITRGIAFRADPLALVLAMGLGWILVTALMSALIVRVALAPLRNLETVAVRIERGELDARASTSRLADRDIARLVHAFNQALDQQAAHRERLRDLARRSLRSEEASSRRIALELREGPGQRLAALLLRLQRVEQEASPQSLVDMLADVRGEIATALEIVGRHSGDRVERLLEVLGLKGAMEWQARQAAREFGLDISVSVGDVASALSRQARLSLLMLVQEALDNVGRHATAHAASVSVGHGNGDRVVVEIVDDGQGFEPGEAVTTGLGLLRMEERIAALGGTLLVTSVPSRGARLRAEIPVRSWAPTTGKRIASEGAA